MEYVNEDELKSALIRINNGLANIHSENDLKRLSKYIKKVKNKKLKNQKLKRSLRMYIVKISERNGIDKKTFEHFGEMIMLVIKNMLKKPNFSGYTYRDEFYSDTSYKILKYIKNFNHRLISKRSGQSVSAFAYISQIVKNSLIFIIDQKKTESEKVKNLVSLENSEKVEIYNESTFEFKSNKILEVQINEIPDTLLIIMEKYLEKTTEEISFIYPKEYKISLNEYEKIKQLNTKYNRNIIIKRRSDA